MERGGPALGATGPEGGEKLAAVGAAASGGAKNHCQEIHDRGCGLRT